MSVKSGVHVWPNSLLGSSLLNHPLGQLQANLPLIWQCCCICLLILFAWSGAGHLVVPWNQGSSCHSSCAENHSHTHTHTHTPWQLHKQKIKLFNKNSIVKSGFGSAVHKQQKLCSTWALLLLLFWRFILHPSFFSSFLSMTHSLVCRAFLSPKWVWSRKESFNTDNCQWQPSWKFGVHFSWC